MPRILFAIGAVIAWVASAEAQTSPGYPTEYAQVVAAAKKEGRLVLYSTTDNAAGGQLLRGFAELYPDLRVDYNDLNSGELYDRFLRENAAGTDSADLLWSSAMDLQVKLVVAGYAATYASPETLALPKWAVWQNQAYGTTYEPITFVYNRRSVPAADVPKDHGALLALLNAKSDVYKGKVTAYNPEKSGVGYLLANEDVKNYPEAWDLFRAFGKASIKLQTSAGDMIDGVASGEQNIGYGVFGSYALTRARKVPDLAIVMPQDYALVSSRVAFISAKAKRPNAAKLFLDFLLSKRGQDIIANQADLYSIREDVTGEATRQRVTEQLGDKALPIPISPDLLVAHSDTQRREFVKKWQAAMKGQ